MWRFPLPLTSENELKSNIWKLLQPGQCPFSLENPFCFSFKEAAIKLQVRLLVASALAAIAGLAFGAQALAQTDPLPSWNDGPAKQSIVNFVKTTTDQSSSSFVPQEERIATFDQDGTLWVEHPIYTQVLYCLDRVPLVAKEKPEPANVEPFKTVLSGDREAIAKLSLHDLFKILDATLAGMSVEVQRCQTDRVTPYCNQAIVFHRFRMLWMKQLFDLVQLMPQIGWLE
jgi:hypothetical protein